jgi:hypothetical protein
MPSISAYNITNIIAIINIVATTVQPPEQVSQASLILQQITNKTNFPLAFYHLANA